jgi:hypothetical protein
VLTCKKGTRLTEGQTLACKWQAAMKNPGNHNDLIENLYKVRNMPEKDQMVDPKRGAC